MASSGMERLTKELQDAKEKLTRQLEVMQEYSSMSIQESSRAKLAEQISRHRQRLSYVDSAIAAVETLVQDGHPEMDLSHLGAVQTEVAKHYEAEGKRLQSLSEELGTEEKPAPRHTREKDE